MPLSPAAHLHWFLPLLERLLAGDQRIRALLRHDPFAGGAPPDQVRARLYRYRFTTRAERRASGAWWHREDAGELVPPVRAADLRARPRGAGLAA